MGVCDNVGTEGTGPNALVEEMRSPDLAGGYASRGNGVGGDKAAANLSRLYRQGCDNCGGQHGGDKSRVCYLAGPNGPTGELGVGYCGVCDMSGEDQAGKQLAGRAIIDDD